jgi:hypothetical protein
MSEAQLDLHCLACGYSLRGIESQRCPECGTPIDRDGLSLPGIPWERRRTIGRIRAYWQTVRIAIIRPRSLAESVLDPVYSDARKFQQVTVLLAFLPLLAAGIWILVNAEADEFRSLSQNFSQHRLGWALEAGLLPLCAGCLWLFLFTATGAASYFFHPRSISIERQNRAITLSYYACAPLALTPAVALGVLYLYLFGDALINQRGGVIAPVAIDFFTILLLGVLLGSLWRVPVAILGSATTCSQARQVALALYLPVAWLFLAAVILVGIPAAYLFVSIVVLSLR